MTEQTVTPRAWQRMLSGRRLDLLDPSPLDVEISDIAHGLARVARWNGQTNGEHAFSVAQHSLLVDQALQLLMKKPDPTSSLYALMHDAPEYVIGDMISPFKSVVGGAYKDVENRLQRAIHLRLGLPSEPADKIRKAIKKADRIIAYFEAIALAGFDDEEANKLFGRPAGFSVDLFDLNPLPTSQAQHQFLGRFEELKGRLD